MRNKVKLLIAFVSLTICLGLMSNTYSRYIAGTTGNVDAIFANWQILVNNTDITDANYLNKEINFTPIIESNAHVADNKLAPSSKGYFDIDIDPSNVDVSFKYSIDLDISNEILPDLKTTNYQILKDGEAGEMTSITDNNVSDILAYEKENPEFKFNKFTVRVYFEWIEGDNETMTDEMDTNVIINSEDLVFNFKAHVSFEQYFA